MPWCNILLLISIVLGSSLRAAKPLCEIKGPIRFGGLNWDSSAILTHLASFVAEKSFGCQSTVIPGMTIPLVIGMARGDVDVMMEIWESTSVIPWKKYKKAGRVQALGTVISDASQGFYVPRYVVEGDPQRKIKAVAPKLKKVSDLPVYASHFRASESLDKGRFYNCVPGWACEIYNTNKFLAYKLDKKFINFRVGSAAALFLALEKAYERGKPFVGYLWAPHWALAKYDMVRLKEPPFDAKIWQNLNSKRPPKPLLGCDFPNTAIVVGASTKFVTKAPRFSSFLSRIRLPTAIINSALLSIIAKDTSPRMVAVTILKQHPKLWQSWLGKNEGKRLRVALDKISQ